MDKLQINATKETPQVIFNPEINKFEISGVSMPEDVFQFYDPVFEWLKNYGEKPNNKTTVQLKLKYLNTASSKIMLNLFFLLEEIAESEFDVKVEWYYMKSDEDNRTLGIEYKEITTLIFDLIEDDF